LLKLGHNTVFYRAKNSKSPMSLTVDLNKNGYEVGQFTAWYNERAKRMPQYMEYEYTTYDQYAEGLKFILGVEKPDVVVLAAAVSDYGVENFVDGKVRSNDMFSIKLKQVPKLIYRVKEWAPDVKLVGFKMLVNSKSNELFEAARKSMTENGCDMIVANDLAEIRDNNHRVHLLTKSGVFQHYTQNESPSDPNYLAKILAEKIIQL